MQGGNFLIRRNTLSLAIFAPFLILSAVLFLNRNAFSSLVASVSGNGSSNSIVTSQLPEKAPSLPLAFEQNKGQVASEASYLSRGSGYTLFLEPTEARFMFATSPVADSGKVDVKNVSMSFVGAADRGASEGRDAFAGTANYFIGNDATKWQTNVPTYGKVVFSEIYPGIDVAYHGIDGTLEYDLMLAPNADASQIRLAVAGASAAIEDGALVISTETGTLRFHAPVSYQEINGARVEVGSAYTVLSNGEIGFTLGSYDKTQPLVIDPILTFSTYFGGSGFEQGSSLRMDTQGNLYIYGYTLSTDLPTTTSLSTSQGTFADLFVAKLNQTATARIYSVILGGEASDLTPEGKGMVVDADGNVYLTGLTSSLTLPVTNDASQPVYGGGGNDAFVMKLAAAGNSLLYSSYLGGSGNDEAVGIAIGESGEYYVTGNTDSIDFPTVNPYKGVLDVDDTDMFVTKLNPDGSLSYSTYLGGSQYDQPGGIANDADGNVYVTGRTTSDDYPLVNAFENQMGGTVDAVVTKLNSTGSALVYSTYLGGSQSEFGSTILTDADGNAYVAGSTYSNDYPLVAPLQAVFKGEEDAFLSKITPDGSALVYSTYLGGTDLETAEAMIIGDDQSVYLAGSTGSADFPIVNPIQGAHGGAIDAYLVKIDGSGENIVYSTYVGGSSTDSGFDLVVDAYGHMYVTGFTFSNDFPVKDGVVQMALGGDGDAFLAKLNIVDSKTVEVGETVTISTAPIKAGVAGITATLTNNTLGSETVRVTLDSYFSNPEMPNVIDIGGGFVDLQVLGADSADTMTAKFYYPSTVTGQAEADLQLLYFNGLDWTSVLSTDGVVPVKTTTDNEDGTISGGYFTVDFSATSSPVITDLLGTVFGSVGGTVLTTDELRTMIQSLDLKRSEEKKLAKELRKIDKKIIDEKNDGAINKLEHFLREVTKLYDNGYIIEESYVSLIDAVTGLMSGLE